MARSLGILALAFALALGSCESGGSGSGGEGGGGGSDGGGGGDAGGEDGGGGGGGSDASESPWIPLDPNSTVSATILCFETDTYRLILSSRGVLNMTLTIDDAADDYGHLYGDFYDSQGYTLERLHAQLYVDSSENRFTRTVPSGTYYLGLEGDCFSDDYLTYTLTSEYDIPFGN